MPEQLVYAHTPPTSPYPPFLNVTATEEGLRITVRNSVDQGGGCGATASITLGTAEAAAFRKAVNERPDYRILEEQPHPTIPGVILRHWRQSGCWSWQREGQDGGQIGLSGYPTAEAAAEAATI